MIVVLSGATGSGKSALAVRLAKEINGEIINADAFQVYREIEIATAAPTMEEKSEVPHHLFAFLSPNEEMNVALYQELARKKIEEILQRGHTPIFVGGSGLYIRSALYDYSFSVDTSSIDLSKEEKMSDEALHSLLASLDPDEAKKIHPNNRRRVMRDIAICYALGRSKTSFLAEQNHEPIYPTKFFILKKDRQSLYASLDKRVDKMFENGLEKEVELAVNKYGKEAPAFKAIGVKEFFPYFEHQATLEETKDLIKLNTRHYVKRQDTFFLHQFPSIYVSSLEETMNRLS